MSVFFRNYSPTGSIIMSRKDDSILETQAIFTIDVLKQLIVSEDKIVFSPYSLTLALAMCYLGARGKTETDFKKLLSPYSEKREYFRMLKNSIEDVQKNSCNLSSIFIANRIFLQNNYTVKEKFKDDIENYLSASFENLDFNDGVKSAKIINDFISNATNNKIRNAVGPNYFPKNTRAIITNALYFKSQWDSVFSEPDTVDGQFYITKNERKNVKMMNKTSLFLYGDNNNFHIVKIPYHNYDSEFILILPKERNKLHSLLREMERNSFFNIIRPAYSGKEVVLTIPKFKVESLLEMKKILTMIGLVSPFNINADFTRVTSIEEFWVEDIAHTVFVDVNEKGTEAGAATIIRARGGGSLPKKPERIIIKADHPFLYVIVNKEKILFSGVYQ
uniref:SERPIN domain-containing protein n=1 Tax=Strongyloides venezuelensis TaxID=75913 RepID=A0A0K0F4M6_STRVS